MCMHRSEIPEIVVQFHGAPQTKCKVKSKNEKMEQEQQQWRKLSGERIKIPIADEVSNVV